MLFWTVECNDVTYGYNCVNNCSGHCLNNYPCNKQTGHCDGGCDPGYKNDDCNDGEINMILIIVSQTIWNKDKKQLTQATKKETK